MELQILLIILLSITLFFLLFTFIFRQLFLLLLGPFLILFGLIMFLTGSGISLIGNLLSGNLSFDWKTEGVQMFDIVLGLYFLIIGSLMVIVGLILVRARKKKIEKINLYGVETEAIVTFVDKNFRILVNKKPIYSIVEFKFRDIGGREYIGRKENVNSDLVIRLGLEVGSKVKIKYLAEDPRQNILILQEPAVMS